MLGYTEDDLEVMINSIYEAKLFYIKYQSDLVDKMPLIRNLEGTIDFLQGILVEGRI
jgi:hypothetical protein